MSTSLITPAVKAVLRDLSLWSAQGIRIAVVQATPKGGVYVGVAGDPVTAEEVLGSRYQFPVACWCFE
jgi:hypothetical protein